MTPAQYNGLLAALASVPGAIMQYAGAAAPTGWLLCDGSAVSRTTYSALFAVCSTTYGAGDGSTTFNLPNLLGRVAIGAGAGAGLTSRALGAKAGAEGNSVAKANLDAFSLVVTDPGHTHGVTCTQDALTVPAQGFLQGSDTGLSPGTVPAAAQSATTGITVASGGSATPLSVMQPYTAVSYIIKT